MSELKSYINRVLGNSLRCLLPSYWWKRLFGLLVDKVEEVDKSVGNKQEKLVSGENIKTINGEDILGNGNIEIKGGSNVTVDAELDKTSVNPIANKAVANALEDKASKTYVTDEIGKIKIKVDTELSEESSNAIANSAVTAALKSKADTIVYEVDLGDCYWSNEPASRFKDALITYGKPQSGIIKVKGRIHSIFQNSELIGPYGLDAYCYASEVQWSNNKLFDGIPRLRTIGGQVIEIDTVHEDSCGITIKRGGTLFVAMPEGSTLPYLLLNPLLIYEGGRADDFVVAYGSESNILKPLEIDTFHKRFTILHDGKLEEWEAQPTYNEEYTRCEVIPQLISSIDIEVSDIDTIRRGAALGATALQSVPAGYVTTTDLQTEISLVETQITGVATTIPQRTSQLNNDSGFTTEEYVNTQVRTAIISALNTEV